MSVYPQKIMIRSGLCLVVLMALLSLGCSTANMPAITDSPDQVTLPGKVVWHDLITDTAEASRHFYGTLFGWEFEQIEVSLGLFDSFDYTLIRHKGRLIGGMVDQSQLQTREDVSQWVSLISVVDVDAATGIVETDGGTVITAPINLADRGRLAVVADPQGALIALLQTDSHDPPDLQQTEVGGFLWAELWTTDVDEAVEFYRRLAGYADENVDVARNRYRLLSSQGKPRAGIMKMPLEELNPIWVNYLRVEDAAALDAIVARVEALGGQILLDPQDRDIGGRVALIAGPSGAGIALQTWPFDVKQQAE